MPFTEHQKAHFIALLQTKDWKLRDGTIWSPGGGLYLNDAHFGNLNPANMHELFSQRAARLEKYKGGLLQNSVGENLQASWAAEEVMKLNS